MMYGDHSCKRADVTVVVPSACLLDESKLDIKVIKGHIRTLGDVSQANFDTVTMANEVGQIVVQNMQVRPHSLLSETSKVAYLLCDKSCGTRRY